MILGVEVVLDHPLIVASYAAALTLLIGGTTALIRFLRWTARVLSQLETNVLPWFRPPSGPGEVDQTIPAELAHIREEQVIQNDRLDVHTGRLTRIERHLKLDHPEEGP